MEGKPSCTSHQNVNVMPLRQDTCHILSHNLKENGILKGLVYVLTHIKTGRGIPLDRHLTYECLDAVEGH